MIYLLRRRGPWTAVNYAGIVVDAPTEAHARVRAVELTKDEKWGEWGHVEATKFSDGSKQIVAFPGGKYYE